LDAVFNYLKVLLSEEWWCTFVIPAFGRQRPEDHRFQVNLSCRVKLCLPPPQKKERKMKKSIN
jgi:hypothetical protein